MYVSLEASRLTVLAVRFCSGLCKESEIGWPAAPFCRGVELAAHCCLNRPSLCCRAAHHFLTLAPRFASTRSFPTIVPADLFRRCRVFALEAGVVTARGCATAAGACRRARFRVSLQQLMPSTMPRRLGALGKRDRPKLSGATAMERAPAVDVLMVAEHQFRRPGKASWQAVALCRGINRRL
jgi:hypothetical protein